MAIIRLNAVKSKFTTFYFQKQTNNKTKTGGEKSVHLN